MRGQQLTALDRDLRSDSYYDKTADDWLWMIDWRVYGLPYCTLYVVCPDNHWPSKIGISVFPRKRVMAMQTSVWRPLKVAHCFWCPSVADARLLEKKLHETLTADAKWLHGEWFDMRLEDAVEMVKFAAAVVGVEASDTLDAHPDVAADILKDIADARYAPAHVEARAEAHRKQMGWRS